MFPQKFYPVALVGVQTQAHPEQMNMVRHEAISGTEQAFTRGGVEHDFTEMSVEQFREPARAAIGNWHCPMNYGVTLIMHARQTWKIKAPVDALAGETGGFADGRCGVHNRMIERTDVRCYLFLRSVKRKLDPSIRKEEMEPTDVGLLRFGSIKREFDHSIEKDEVRAGSRRAATGSWHRSTVRSVYLKRGVRAD